MKRMLLLLIVFVVLADARHHHKKSKQQNKPEAKLKKAQLDCLLSCHRKNNCLHKQNHFANELCADDCQAECQLKAFGSFETLLANTCKRDCARNYFVMYCKSEKITCFKDCVHLCRRQNMYEIVEVYENALSPP